MQSMPAKMIQLLRKDECESVELGQVVNLGVKMRSQEKEKVWTEEDCHSTVTDWLQHINTKLIG